MNIDEFYDEVPSRRGAWELEFGADWLDARSRRWIVGWISTTGELYAMAAPLPSGLGSVRHPGRLRSKDLPTYVLARISAESNARKLLGEVEHLRGQTGGMERLVDVLTRYLHAGDAEIGDLLL